MRLLLDTHLLLWALGEPRRLSAKILDRLEDPANTILFSTASIWEISIKAGLKRADFAVAPTRIYQEAVAIGFTELLLSASAALRVADLPHHHRDPFDRLLVAQAVDEPAILLTANAQLTAYSGLVECVR